MATPLDYRVSDSHTRVWLNAEFVAGRQQQARRAAELPDSLASTRSSGSVSEQDSFGARRCHPFGPVTVTRQREVPTCK